MVITTAVHGELPCKGFQKPPLVKKLSQKSKLLLSTRVYCCWLHLLNVMDLSHESSFKWGDWWYREWHHSSVRGFPLKLYYALVLVPDPKLTPAWIAFSTCWCWMLNKLRKNSSIAEPKIQDSELEIMCSCMFHQRSQAKPTSLPFRGPYRIVGLWKRTSDRLVDQVTRQSELLSVDFADVQKRSMIPPVQPLIQTAKHQVWRVKVGWPSRSCWTRWNTKWLEGPSIPLREAKRGRLRQGLGCGTFETM